MKVVTLALALGAATGTAYAAKEQTELGILIGSRTLDIDNEDNEREQYIGMQGMYIIPQKKFNVGVGASLEKNHFKTGGTKFDFTDLAFQASLQFPVRRFTPYGELRYIIFSTGNTSGAISKDLNNSGYDLNIGTKFHFNKDFAGMIETTLVADQSLEVESFSGSIDYDYSLFKAFEFGFLITL